LFDSVYVIDRSTGFAEISDYLCGDAGTDRVIVGDWLDTLPHAEGRFDLIASHFTHGNVSFAERPAFFSAVRRALSPTGLFFDTVFQPRRPLYGAEEIVCEFQHAPITTRTLNDLSCKGIFLSDPIDSLGYVDTSVAYDWLLETHHTRAFERAVELTTEMITPRGTRWDYHPDASPESLGYLDSFERLFRSRHEDAGPFANCVEVWISKARRHACD
jgi:SAM-dependent methyltransferase